METITHGKLKHKFEKKKRYLMHHQLLEQISKGSGLMLRLNCFIYVGFYLILHEYPLFLASLDFSFTVLALIFLFIIKPKMLRGEIPGYYRRDYGNMKSTMIMIQFFIQGGLMRLPILMLYYGVTFYLVRDNPVEVVQYKEAIMEIIINPKVSILALVSFAIAMYLLFYHEKYASIREFSNSVVEIYSSYPYTEEGAVKEFIRRKDQALELVNINGVKYDGKWNSHSTSASKNKHKNTETAMFSEEQYTTEMSEEMIDSSVHRESKDRVRRKARK